MNRIDEQARVNNFFQNTIFYDTQSVNDAIQDGVDEICAFTGCVYKSATLVFDQYRTYYDMLSRFPDYIGVIALFNKTINRWMFPQSMKKFNQVRIDWDTAYGTPYYFCPINHRYVAIYKKPGSANYGSFVIFYRAAAPILNNTTPIPIPDDHITALDSYAIVDLWEQQQEWGKAEEWMQTYEADLEKLRILMRNQRNRDRYMSLR